ncbi:MAG: ChaN family lipoprotein [Bacteroidetes bacterium]|nr:ChaN family lipoprotein [Bacteroidota bacterium]
MKRINYLLVVLILLFFVQADMPAYKLFNNKGKKAKFSKLVEDASRADVVFFGELHNNSICHWLQLELAKSLKAKSNKTLVLGAEMFESDQQIILNEYLDGMISSKNLESGTHLWKNYTTDYKPLVNFARENKLPFIATNVPRRYASFVAKKGLDSLNAVLGKHPKRFIAPLPILFDPELPGYKGMTHGGGMPGLAYLPQAQAIKDATMAYFISQNYSENTIFLHFNGAYHSQNYEGIIWYLKKYMPEIKIMSINTVVQDTINNLKEKYFNSADYIIVVDEDVTNTY